MYTYSWHSSASAISVHLNQPIKTVNKYIYIYIYSNIDIKKVDKQLTHAMHAKYRYMNGTLIDKLIK